MSKSVLLIGLGEFGMHMARKLSEMDIEVLAVDKDEEKVNDALEYVTEAQIGDSTDEDFLRTLDIKDFDACVVTIGGNFQNSLETTCLLHEMGAVKVVSRANTEIHEKFLKRNGADMVVYPERQMANWTAVRCAYDHILDYIGIDENYSIYELKVPEDWCGKELAKIDSRNRYGINILGVRKNGSLNMDIGSDTILHSDETILVLGSQKSLHKCFKI